MATGLVFSGDSGDDAEKLVACALRSAGDGPGIANRTTEHLLIQVWALAADGNDDKQCRAQGLFGREPGIALQPLHFVSDSVPSFGRDRRQQRLLVGEMAIRRTATDAYPCADLAQRHRRRTAGIQQGRRFVEQRTACRSGRFGAAHPAAGSAPNTPGLPLWIRDVSLTLEIRHPLPVRANAFV